MSVPQNLLSLKRQDLSAWRRQSRVRKSSLVNPKRGGRKTEGAKTAGKRSFMRPRVKLVSD